tara:strand:+ start:937 stop:1470 length:534 start_codon:yes stop_codon:yes gene_type:complete
MNELIKNRIEAKHKSINEMNKYINKIMPQIINILKDDLKPKKDGTINKKAYDKTQEIIYKNKPKNITCFITNCTEGLGDLRVKSSYKYDDKREYSSYSYVEKSFNLWSVFKYWKKGDCICTYDFNKITINDFTPIKNKSLKSVLNTIKKTELLKSKIELLNNKITDNEKGFYHYLIK